MPARITDPLAPRPRKKADIPRPPVQLGSSPSLREAVDALIVHRGWRGQTPENCRAYMLGGRFRAFCEAHGIVSITDLTSRHVLEFFGLLEKLVDADGRPTPAARNTLRRYRNYLKQLADFCATVPGYAAPELVAGAIPRVGRPPKNRRPKALTVEEERALVAACMGRELAIVMLLLATGLRVGELCALTVNDVDLTARPPRIHVSKSAGDLRGTKTDRDRDVTIRQPYTHSLPRLLAGLVADQGRGVRRELILGTGRWRGQPTTVDGVQQMLTRISRPLGFHVTPHMLRHTWATRLADAGMDINGLMDLGGWESIEMVRLYYSSDSKRAMQRAAELYIAG